MTAKRFDRARARVNGAVHYVPLLLRSPDDALYRSWLEATGKAFENETACRLRFRHATLPTSTQISCMECLGMTDVELLSREVERMKADHNRVCQLVAEMHAAATGRVGHGPERGVVEDIHDLRKRALLAEDRAKTLEAALAEAQLEINQLRLVCLSA